MDKYNLLSLDLEERRPAYWFRTETRIVKIFTPGGNLNRWCITVHVNTTKRIKIIHWDTEENIVSLKEFDFVNAESIDDDEASNTLMVWEYSKEKE